MSGFIDSNGNYYEGDKVVWTDKEVPQRPDSTYKWNGKEWVIADEIIKAQEVDRAKTKLIEIDLKSIRSIREWIAKQDTAPQYLKDVEVEAVIEREKICIIWNK